MKNARPPDAASRDEQAAHWCLGLANEVLTADDRETFALWMKDPDNAEALQSQVRLWNLTHSIASKPELVRMRREALDTYHRINSARWSAGPVRPSKRGYWAVAAGLLLMIGVAVWQFPALIDRSAPAVVAAGQEYTAGLGAPRVASLDDGSRLSLDASSAVRVSMTSSQRAVELTRGRAGFVVAKGERPFSVRVGDNAAVATGTRFSVEKLGDIIQIILFEGSLTILKGDKETARMTAGDVLSVAEFGGGPPRLSAAGSATMQSWEAGHLEFVEEPLAVAVQRMNRYAPRPVVLSPDVPSGLRLTGVFDGSDPAGFAQGAAAILNLRLTNDGDHYLLHKR